MYIQLVDGMTVECDSFRAIDAGILLFESAPRGDNEDREAHGFIPYQELKYVLPDEQYEQMRPSPGPRMHRQQRSEPPPQGQRQYHQQSSGY